MAALLVVGLMLSSPAAGAQTRHVFAVSALINGNPPNGVLYQYTSSNDTTWSESNSFTINGHAGTTVFVYSPNIASFAGGGQICVAYVGFDSPTQQMRQHIMRSTDGVNWTDTDLTANGSVLPDINSGVAGFTDANGLPRLFYVTKQSNGIEVVAEAFWNGNAWVNEGPVGLTAAEPGTVIAAYLFNTSRTSWYIGTDGHIHELFKDTGGWMTTDVTAASGAPLPIDGSNLLGYKFNSNAPIHFFTSDGHVHQIWWNGSAWKTDDVTQLAKTAPSCSAGRQNGVPAPLAGYMFNSQPHVNCFTGDIIQMWWTGSQELWNDWTANSGFCCPNFAPITGYAIGADATIFYVSGQAPPDGLPIHEYLWNGTTTQDIQVQQILYTPVALASAIF